MSYTESFKIRVVKEYQKGGVSKEFLKKKYAISGNSTISKWIKKYSSGAGEVSFKLADELEMAVKETLAKEELLKKLEESQLKVAALEALLEAAAEHTGIDLKKKFGSGR